MSTILVDIFSTDDSIRMAVEILQNATMLGLLIITLSNAVVRHFNAIVWS